MPLGSLKIMVNESYMAMMAHPQNAHAIRTSEVVLLMVSVNFMS